MVGIFPVGSADALAEAIQRGLTLVGSADVQKRCLELVSGYTVEAAASGIAQAYRAVTGR